MKTTLSRTLLEGPLIMPKATDQESSLSQDTHTHTTHTHHTHTTQHTHTHNIHTHTYTHTHMCTYIVFRKWIQATVKEVLHSQLSEPVTKGENVVRA